MAAFFLLPCLYRALFWLCRQSAANSSLADFPVFWVKYTEIIIIAVFRWADGHQVSSYKQAVGPPPTDNPNF
jgi:hypothetical protein